MQQLFFIIMIDETIRGRNIRPMEGGSGTWSGSSICVLLDIDQ